MIGKIALPPRKTVDERIDLKCNPNHCCRLLGSEYWSRSQARGTRYLDLIRERRNENPRVKGVHIRDQEYPQIRAIE